MSIEVAIIGILLVNLLAFGINELRRLKKKKRRASTYGRMNNKIDNLEFNLKEQLTKNKMLENRIDFIQVDLDRYVKWFEDSNISVPILNTNSLSLDDTYTKPTESVKSNLVDKLKDTKDTTARPSDVGIRNYMYKYDLSRKQAYSKLYYELNRDLKKRQKK